MKRLRKLKYWRAGEGQRPGWTTQLLFHTCRDALPSAIVDRGEIECYSVHLKNTFSPCMSYDTLRVKRGVVVGDRFAVSSNPPVSKKMRLVRWDHARSVVQDMSVAWVRLFRGCMSFVLWSMMCLRRSLKLQIHQLFGSAAYVIRSPRPTSGADVMVDRR